MNGKLEFKSFLAKRQKKITANFGLRCRVRMNICWTSKCNVYNEGFFLEKNELILRQWFYFYFFYKTYEKKSINHLERRRMFSNMGF